LPADYANPAAARIANPRRQGEGEAQDATPNMGISQKDFPDNIRFGKSRIFVSATLKK
jgi:hypothetical protein